MKSNFIILILSLIYICNLQAQGLGQYREGDSIVAGRGCSQGFYKEYTFKPKDVNSYEQLASHFGKDTFYAYFKGSPIKNIDVKKAAITYAKKSDSDQGYFSRNNLFLTDGTTTYHEATEMKNVDASNVYYMFDSSIPLFRSNNNVYFEGHLLDKLKPEKTMLIDAYSNETFYFFADGKSVYRNEIIIENADASSFATSNYLERVFEDGKYIYKQVADSRDKKNFYFNGRKVKPYPKWKETKFFPDSIYNKQYTVTFISEYQEQDENAKPAINFYLNPTDFERLTKNRILKRKTELELDKSFFINEVKGYTIKTYKNKELKSTYYYEEDLEEWDIKGFTQIHFIGNGFHLSKKDFNLLRESGKPIKYFEEELQDYHIWKQKIENLIKSDKVISYETGSYHFWPIDMDGKTYRKQIYDYWIDSNNTQRSDLAYYQGLFTFKIESKKILSILGKAISDFDHDKQQDKKNELIKIVLGSGENLIHNHLNTIMINNMEWTTLNIFCSKEFMKNVPKENIQYEWQPIIHIINWQEK